MVRARKSEVTAILDLLHEEWESEGDLAQALLDKFFELLADRNLYGIRWGGMAYGPFATKQQADKLVRALDGGASTCPLCSVNTFAAVVDKANPPDKRYCPECKHPVFAHGFSMPKGCAVRECNCRQIFR